MSDAIMRQKNPTHTHTYARISYRILYFTGSILLTLLKFKNYHLSLKLFTIYFLLLITSYIHGQNKSQFPRTSNKITLRQ